jgi:hypothetical protein
MSGRQRAQRPQQVGDGPSPHGQQGGQSQEDEAVVGGAGEGGLERVAEDADRFRELRVLALELASRGAGLALLLPSGRPEAVPDLLRGGSRAGPIG